MAIGDAVFVCNSVDKALEQRWLAAEVVLKDAEAKGDIPVTYPAALSKIYYINTFMQSAVMTVSFQTDRSGQTVQTQIRRLLSLIRVFTICNTV